MIAFTPMKTVYDTTTEAEYKHGKTAVVTGHGRAPWIIHGSALNSTGTVFAVLANDRAHAERLALTWLRFSWFKDGREVWLSQVTEVVLTQDFALNTEEKIALLELYDRYGGEFAERANTATVKTLAKAMEKIAA